MHLAGVARLEEEPHAGALAPAHQVVVDGPRREEARDGRLLTGDLAVGQDQDVVPVGDRLAGLRLERLERARARAADAAGPPGGPRRLRPADAGDDRHRDARAGPPGLPRLAPAAAHGVRRHRRGDQGDQRHRARLLPVQAVGPAGGAALPGRRRPARRLAPGAPDEHVAAARGGPPVVRPELRGQDVPHPQPRALPLARRRARRGGRPAARPGAAGRDDLPLVLVPDGEALRSPSTLELADALGLRTRAEQPLYDLCIVGGGPAGPRRGRLRRVRGPAHRRRRARRPGRSGGPERLDRELPRLPQGALRRRPHPPRGRPGRPLRRRDRARPRRGRVRGARAGARGPLRRRRRDRGAGACSSPPACPTAGSRRAGIDELGVARRLLRRVGQRGPRSAQGEDVYVVGAANSAGQAVLNFARYAKRVVMLVRGSPARGHHVAVPRRPDPGRRERRGAAPHRGGRGRRRRPPGGAHPAPTATTGTEEDVPTSWLFVFIGAVAAHRLARRRRRAGRQGLRRHRPGPAGRGTGPRRGRSPGRRTRSRPACPACSPPATSASTR